MKTTALMAIAAAQIFALPLSAQTFDREGRLIVAPEERNIAAAQVAVAQTRLFGSMLVSYRIARPGVARVAVATRYCYHIKPVLPNPFEPLSFLFILPT
jgi:uncharacterized lipoprotein YbaY